SCINSPLSVGTHRITAHAGSIERRMEGSFPFSSGPITTRSQELCPFACHKSLLNTVIRGDWRSVCQHADSSRANSAYSVRIRRFACRNGERLPGRPFGTEKVFCFTAFLLRPARKAAVWC